MNIDDFKLNIAIGKSQQLNYQRAIKTGNLLELREILLDACSPNDRERITRLLPDDLVL